MSRRSLGWSAAVLLAGACAASPASATFIGNSQGGTEFPEGAASFADEVVFFAPSLVNGEPSASRRNPAATLGVPNYVGGSTCDGTQACAFASLGDGGSITLRFTDNLLTGSDSSALDLWVFEVGDDVEDTFVEISTDGATWFSVGKVFGSTAGIDLDAFGFGAANRFSYVRLTDDGNEGDQTGPSVGADIDAVGAISTQIVPEPNGASLLGFGLATLLLCRRLRVRAVAVHAQKCSAQSPA